jgi:hypothetical protein
MEVNNNVTRSIDNKPLNTSSKKEDKKIEDKKISLDIQTKDYIKIDTSSKKSTEVFTFLDDNDKFNIKINDNQDIKATYDKDNKVATISSDNEKFSSKTIVDEKSQALSTELTKKDNDSLFKISTGFDTKESQFKPIGIESNNKDTNLKALYDPNKNNLSGEINQKIGNQDIKIKSQYSLDSSDKSGKLGLEYSNSGFKINTDYSGSEQNKDLNLNLKHEQIEINTNFDADKNFNLNGIQVAKPIKISENLPTANISVDYDNTKNSFKKVGVDINTNVSKDISVTFSSNLAKSAKEHAVKLNYDVYTNTKVSLEANMNGVDTSKSGYKISFSSGFKF